MERYKIGSKISPPVPVLDLVPVEYCRGGEGTVTNTTGHIFVVLTKKTQFISIKSEV